MIKRNQNGKDTFFMDNCRMNYRSVPNRRSCPPATNNPCMQPREDTCPINANCLEQYPLAMGYIPRQKFNNVYDTCKALSKGTIFPELCKPFCGKGGGCRC